MKLIALICFMLVAFVIPTNSQSVICRVSSGMSYFYYPSENNEVFLQSLINDCENGDTLYFPGTIFHLNGPIYVDRKIVFIGAGIQPDSTQVTGITHFDFSNWSMEFRENSDYSEMHGIKITNDGVRTDDFSNVVGLKFIRCEIEDIGLNSASNGILIQECIIPQSIDVEEAQNVIIRNSVFSGLYDGTSSTVVENCILLNFNQSFDNSNNNVLYRNNIITRDISTTLTVAEASIFRNNLWITKPGSPTDIDFTSNVIGYSGNQKTNQIAQVFTNAFNYLSYKYDADYHVIAGPYKTMGTDGKEVGIFGSLTPMKIGLHPFNPHWQQFDLPNASSGGILQNVLIKASAQHD